MTESLRIINNLSVREIILPGESSIPVLLCPEFKPIQYGFVWIRIGRDGIASEADKRIYEHPTYRYTHYNEKYNTDPGDYIVASQVIEVGDKSWLLSPQSIGTGKDSEVFLCFCPQDDTIGVAKIALDSSHNRNLEREWEIIKTLEDLPEVAKPIQYVMQLDRRINICSLGRSTKDHPFIKLESKPIDLGDLSLEDMIRLVVLQKHALIKWFDRGVTYRDWQLSEILIMMDPETPSELRSFVAIDFSNEEKPMSSSERSVQPDIFKQRRLDC